MTPPAQAVPVRLYRTDDRFMLAAPMPGVEPGDISVKIDGDRITIRAEERGPHQHGRDLLIVEWAIGPYQRELTLPEAVDGSMTNVTYDNGVLVLSMPKARPGATSTPAEIRLEPISATRGERVGHVGREPRPTSTREHRDAKHGA